MPETASTQNSQIRATDTNITIIVDTGGYDISAATDLSVSILAPDGVTQTFVAATNATLVPYNDNKHAQFMTTATTFTQVGAYTLQLRAFFADGRRLRSPEQIFFVGPILR